MKRIDFDSPDMVKLGTRDLFDGADQEDIDAVNAADASGDQDAQLAAMNALSAKARERECVFIECSDCEKRTFQELFAQPGGLSPKDAMAQAMAEGFALMTEYTAMLRKCTGHA
jgi:hypothetical protein